jgi:hypothetical protein
VTLARISSAVLIQIEGLAASCGDERYDVSVFRQDREPRLSKLVEDAVLGVK